MFPNNNHASNACSQLRIHTAQRGAAGILHRSCKAARSSHKGTLCRTGGGFNRLASPHSLDVAPRSIKNNSSGVILPWSNPMPLSLNPRSIGPIRPDKGPRSLACGWDLGKGALPGCRARSRCGPRSATPVRTARSHDPGWCLTGLCVFKIPRSKFDFWVQWLHPSTEN